MTTASLAEASAGGVPLNRIAVTISVMMATIVQVLDNTIANVALPQMQGSFSVSQEEISWVLTSYIVATAIATSVTGYLAGRLGRKRLFMGSLAGFVAASMLCGAAPSLEVLVIARLLQGASGAALIPLSQSVLLDTFPRHQQGQAMAIWAMGVMTGPILGPTIGGYITEFYGWRWVFYINLPIGIATLIGLWTFLPETPREYGRRFGWFGFALLSLGIGAFQAMVDRGEVKGWFASTEIVVETLISVIGIYMFVVHMTTSGRPFLPPALFLNRNFVISAILMPLSSITLMASVVLMPPFLEHIQGYPAYMVGFLMMPRGFGNLLALVVAGWAANRVDGRWIIFVGLVIAALGAHYMTEFTTDVDADAVLWTGFLQGFGLGMVWVPLSTIAFETLDPRLRTEATSLFNLARNIGASVGISFIILLLGQNTQANHAALSAHVSPFNPAFRAEDVPPNWSLTESKGLAAIDAEITRQAAMTAYVDDFLVLVYTPLAAIPLLLLFRGVKGPVRTRAGATAVGRGQG